MISSVMLQTSNTGGGWSTGWSTGSCLEEPGFAGGFAGFAGCWFAMEWRG